MSDVLILKLTDKIDLRRGESVALSDVSIYYTWKNIKKSYNHDKFKILVPAWNDKFELPDGSYLIADIQDYCEYIYKIKHGENIDNPSIRIYVNKIENRVTFKIKTGYYLEFLTPQSRNYGINISSLSDCQQWLLRRFKDCIYICSK